MNANIQRLCVLCAIPMIIVWMIGFWAFAGFLPPPSPTHSAIEIAQMFAAHRNMIRIGLLLTSFGATLLAPFFGVITVQMKRIEGTSSPLAYAQLAMAALIIIEFIFPLYFLQAAAFRADRDITQIQLFHDVAWLLFVGVVSTAVLQYLMIGLAILSDRRSEPIFPRWFGYLTLWAALLFSPGGLCVFFKTGPFAWQGLLCWWVPLSAFGIWFIVATVLLLRIITRQEREEPAPDAAAAPRGATDVNREIDSLASEVTALRSEVERLRQAMTSEPA